MVGILLNAEKSTDQDDDRSALEDNGLCVEGLRGLRKLMESSNVFVKITLFLTRRNKNEMKAIVLR